MLPLTATITLTTPVRKTPNRRKMAGTAEVFLKDLRPVGEFVSDHEKRTIAVQPNAVRCLNHSLIRDHGHNVNLQGGIDKFETRVEFRNKLFPMLCFLKLADSTYGPLATSEAEEFICTRTSLVQIASSAYNSEHHEDTQFDDGFLLVLFKRNQRYYLCEYNTPSKKDKAIEISPWMYAGLKFENYVTLSENQVKPDLDYIASSKILYNAVFKTLLVDKNTGITHKLFYPAKIDCIDKDGGYTEIKCRKQPIGYGRSWWRTEMVWHLQCLFADIKHIVVGFANGIEKVKKVKKLKIDMLDYEKGKHWDVKGCLSYLSKFLTDAKQQLDQTEDGTYYYAFRSPNQNNYTITNYRA